MGVTTPDCVWPVEATLGEGPVWWDGQLWFTDIKQNKVHCFTPDTGARQSWGAPSPVGFLAPRSDGHFIAGAKTGLYDFHPGTGSFTLMRTVEPDRPGNRLNDGAVDAKGRLWFGSMDDAEAEPTGKLYCLDGGTLTVRDENYIITNGPAFSPDGKTLYHTDTLKKEIYAFNLGDDGALSNRRIFATIEEGAGYPDGPVVDAEGYLWTGLFAGFAVRRYAPDGALHTVVRFPCANVTKIAFGGANGKTVYATTARKGLDSESLRAQPLAGGLFCFAAETRGQSQACVLVSN